MQCLMRKMNTEDGADNNWLTSKYHTGNLKRAKNKANK